MRGTTSRASRVLRRLTSGLSGLGAMLVVLCLGMVVGSFVIPSPPPQAQAVEQQPSKYADLTPASPVRLVVPALGIAAPIVPISVTGTVLDPPQDPLLVGWWKRSAEPGQRTGQTVITGHTVHTGGGAMDRVDTLKPGQRIDVITREGTMRYSVTEVSVLDKDDVAEAAVDLFGQVGGNGRLVLVSCSEWNGESYESNVVVFGDPLGTPIRKNAADSGPTLEAAG